MKISEIFYSLQAEGPQLGMPAWFIRTSGCNLSCLFCDSKYAKNGTEMSIEEIINSMNSNSCKNVILTGGEPTLQKDFPNIIKELTHKGFNIYVETNGTIYTPMQIGFATFIVSPKLDFITPKYFKTLSKWVAHGTFKFVIRDRKDFDDTVKFCNSLELRDVYFMPEGIKEEQLKPKMLQLAEWIKELGWGYLTPRIQVYLWGMKRGT